jgi:tRNA(Arg) A34 adenosine deaminase TadA
MAPAGSASGQRSGRAQPIGMTEPDERRLRRAFALAAEARAEGNHPFGCLLVSAAGEVLGERRNAGVLPVAARTIHAETELARAASREHSPAQLRDCTLYTSAEPCAMCAGTIYWAGIGRVVYGLSERELKSITGDHPDNPTLDLPCREVFARGQFAVEVVGPALVEEARAVHAGYWG